MFVSEVEKRKAARALAESGVARILMCMDNNDDITQPTMHSDDYTRALKKAKVEIELSQAISTLDLSENKDHKATVIEFNRAQRGEK